jgi:hypothetical protein
VTLTPEFVVLIPNPDSSMEILYDGCDSPVSPGGGCTIEVTFKPRSPGPKEATLEVASFTEGTTSAVAHLTGAGTAPKVSIDPTSIDFGTLPLGTNVPPSRVITITNSGSVVLSIGEIGFHLISGAGSEIQSPFGSFTENTCRGGLTLPVGGSCTITMSFAPRVLGPAAAELRIVDDALDSPQIIHLSGAGSPEVVPSPPVPRPELARATLQRHPAKRTKSRNATFTFSGNATATGFECRLDKQPPRSCTSPMRYRSLKPGNHYFSVRAVTTVPNAGGQAIGSTYGWHIARKPAHKKHPHHQHVK